MSIRGLSMFDIDDVVRYIAGYGKIPGKHGNCYLEVEYEFAWPVPLSFLQDLYGIPHDYPDEGVRYMIDSFPIDQKKAEALQPFVKEKLDLDKYDFMLECSDKASYESAKAAPPKEEKIYTHEDLTRFIEAFPNEPDENAKTWMKTFELQKPISIEFINKLFNVGPDDELFWGDEIDDAQARALQPYFKEKLDTKKYTLIFTARPKK